MEYHTSIFVVLFTTLASCTPSQRTPLARNKGVYATTAAADINELPFEHFLSRSKIFIDKTLLISELIFKRHTSSVIACPRKWGKTTSLKMLACFLGIEVDLIGKKVPREETVSYELFRYGQIIHNGTRILDLVDPLLISDIGEDLLDRYQGEAPVIYVDFHSIRGNNHIEFINSFKAEISQVFKVHSYLVECENSFNKSYVDKYYLFRKREAKAIDLLGSLVFLCELLHRHFNKRVYILIDSYDWPITAALLRPKYPKKEQTAIFFRNFLAATINANEYLEMAILTGTFTISQLRFLKEVNITNEYSLSSKNHDIIEFYGFNQSNVDALLHHNLIPTKGRELAQQWYNGYHLTRSTYEIYNPHSIMHFAATRTIGTYWVHNDTTDSLLKNALYNPLLEKAFVILLTGNPYYIRLPKLHLRLHDFDSLGKSHGYDAFNMAIELLLAAGYLVPSRPLAAIRQRNEIPLKIPNQEAHYTLKKLAIAHFESRFNSSRPIKYEYYMRSAALALQLSVSQFNCTCPDLELPLRRFLHVLPPFSDDPNADIYNRELLYGDHHVLLALFYFIILTGENFSFFDSRNNAFLDVNYILLRNKDVGVAIEVKFNELFADEGSLNVDLYNSTFRKRKFCKKMKIFQIAVMKNKTIRILCQRFFLT